MKRKTTTSPLQRRIALRKGKKPDKHVRDEGEDGGSLPPVHFLVCAHCGRLGAAANVTLTNAAAIRRCIRRSLAEAPPKVESERSDVRTNSTEGNTRGMQLSLEGLLKGETEDAT